MSLTVLNFNLATCNKHLLCEECIVCGMFAPRKWVLGAIETNAGDAYFVVVGGVRTAPGTIKLDDIPMFAVREVNRSKPSLHPSKTVNIYN